MQSGYEEETDPDEGGAPPEIESNQRSAGPDAMIAFLATATVCLLALLVAIRLEPGWFGLQSSGGQVGALAPRPAQPSGPGADMQPRPVVPRAPSEQTLAQTIFADALPSVVHVTTRSRVNVVNTTEFISGTGSGLVWDERGHIVTCHHVLADARSAFVTLSDGSVWEAKLVGLDPVTDLAVVRIDAPPDKLTPIRVGTSSDLRVGGRVYSVACPYGLGHSLSVGYVSGLDRRIKSTSERFLDGTIQTDAAIHPGSSGGALIDDQGRVVGINAAIHLDSRRQVGVGFAQPVDRLQATVPSIIANGFRWTPHFGFVTASDLNSATLLRKIEPQERVPEFGIVVVEVAEGGPASLAGLRSMQTVRSATGEETLAVRDVIVAAGGRRVAVRADLDAAIAGLEGNEPLVLTVARFNGDVELVLRPRYD